MNVNPVTLAGAATVIQAKGIAFTGRTRRSEAGLGPVVHHNRIFGKKQPKLGGTTDRAFVPRLDERVFVLEE